jgi:hypothetical protein
MLQLLMAAQKGQLNKTEDEDVGTIGEDAADSELHKKHMSSKKGDALSNVNFVCMRAPRLMVILFILLCRNYEPRHSSSSFHIFLCWI